MNIKEGTSVIEKKKRSKVVENKKVIFVGSGVVWGDGKSKIRFNKNYLYETEDKDEIEFLKERGYKTITLDTPLEMRVFMEHPELYLYEKKEIKLDAKTLEAAKRNK